MLLRKKFYLQIEYHWYCINLLKKQLNDSKKKQKTQGKINYHKQKASVLSYQYEILVGLRDENGAFVN
ncbi:MAG: hypothetical protein IKJ86_07730 [Clostridia bacterium]|nr:hypothetical protein [Clostridia bacterium]